MPSVAGAAPQRTVFPDFEAGLAGAAGDNGTAAAVASGVSRHLLRRQASSANCACPRTAM